MSIQIVYGTSGIGKSTYIFNQINEQIKQKSPYKIKVITPEQFSYTAEHERLLALFLNSEIVQIS